MFCTSQGAQDQRWSDSLQLVCRGLVLVIVSSLYANLFVSAVVSLHVYLARS